MEEGAASLADVEIAATVEELATTVVSAAATLEFGLVGRTIVFRVVGAALEELETAATDESAAIDKGAAEGVVSAGAAEKVVSTTAA